MLNRLYEKFKYVLRFIITTLMDQKVHLAKITSKI